MRYTLFIYIAVLLAFGTQRMHAQATDEVAGYVQQARDAQAKGDAEGSLAFLDKAYEKRCFAKPFDADAWAEVVTLKAMAYGMKYDWDKAIKLCQDAYLILLTQPHTSQYAETVHALATFYAGRGNAGDMAKATSYALVAREFYSKKTREYFTCGNDLAYYYMFQGNTKEAQNMAHSAIKSGEDIFEGNLNELAKELWDKAEDIAELEQYPMAETYGLSSIGVMEKTGDTLSNDYMRRLVKLAGYYYQQRNFRSEILYLEQAAPVASQVKGPESKEYVDCLRKLALAYNHLTNDMYDEKEKKEKIEETFKQSEKYEDMAREILIKTNRLDEIREHQLPLISNSALGFYNEGDTEKALKYELIAAQLYEKTKDNTGLANSYSHLATFYNKMNDKDNTLKYGKMAVQMYDQTDSIDAFKQMTYNNVSIYLHNAGDDNEALKYGLKSVNALEQLGDTVSELYAKALNNVSIYYNSLGNSEKAIEYSARASGAKVASIDAENAALLASIKKKKKKNAQEVQFKTLVIDRNMVIMEWNKAVYADNENNEKVLHEAYSNALKLQRQLFIEKYTNSDATARKAEWDVQRPIFDFASTLAYGRCYDTDLVEDAWNAMLISDGINKFIQTGDSTFISTTWSSMRDALPEGTAIVRFFTTETNNGVGHSALVLRKEWSEPKAVVPLFSEKEIFPISWEDGKTVPDLLPTPEGRQRIVNEPRVGRFILEPVLKALGDLTTIKELRYHQEGLLIDLDPALFYIDEGKPVKSLFPWVKE